MPPPRDPGRDLRLEPLGDDRKPAHFGEAAHVAPSLESASRESRAAYEALIDAVFTAPGASEWLIGLRMAIAAYLASKDKEKEKEVVLRAPVASDAIRAAEPGPR